MDYKAAGTDLRLLSCFLCPQVMMGTFSIQIPAQGYCYQESIFKSD